MGLMDKMKEAAKKAMDTAESAAQKVQETVEQQKQASVERREAREKLEAERLKKARDAVQAKSNQFHSGVDSSQKSLLSRFIEKELLDFTKNFYERIYMPCNDAQYSDMSIGSYIDEAGFEFQMIPRADCSGIYFETRLKYCREFNATKTDITTEINTTTQGNESNRSNSIPKMNCPIGSPIMIIIVDKADTLPSISGGVSICTNVSI